MADSPRFDNRVVVLTGVGRRGQVGEAVATAFAAAGATLILVDRDAQQVSERAAEIGGAVAAGRVHARACDLTDAAAVVTLAREVAAAHGGRVHALVNMAGGFALSGPVADSDPAMLQKQIAINCTTAYHACRAFIPSLRGGGSIVFFSSAAAMPGAKGAGLSAYAASKAGVLAVMRAVAEEERANGIRANALAPTAIRTGDNLRDMGDGVRYVEREEVAAAVLYLCSDVARSVSGQVVQLG
jgi:NAD(P)-dependent dehydrogenase (short-subunit alcohol dehydrogenase family)